MTKQEKLAAWVGIIGFVAGTWGFIIFVLPKVREEYGF